MTGQDFFTLEGIWKVFGPRPDRAIALSLEGTDRSEVQEATGCTLAVRDVSLSVARGETFVVMGLSGSGKSTLIRCAARLAEPTRGTVILDGDDITAMGSDALRDVRRSKMSMVFQHFGLFPHRRVIDNAAYGLEVRGIARPERRRIAAEVLETVGLGGWGDHYPQQLSGGMQQRVGLARALAVDPELMFFDEPFSALDPLIRRDMQDELLRLQSEQHRTIVFITHDFDEAIRLGDRIAIMKDGAVDQVGTASELIASPATEYVKDFTKDIPRAQVLSAADVATDQAPPADAESVAASTRVQDLLPRLLTSTAALAVVDPAGRPLGTIDREAVAELLAEQR